MNTLKGDFIGFSYDGIHSSELGLVRVSDGSRYNDNLLPALKPEVIEKPSGAGAYFLKNSLGEKHIVMSLAFDRITEEKLERIRRVFSKLDPVPLILDEMPYKAYWVVPSGEQQLTYICFDEGETNRIYKGELNLDLTCYDAYARSTKKYREDFINYSNFHEWNNSIKLKSKTEIDKIIDNSIYLYNPGVVETDFKLYLKPTGKQIEGIKISLSGSPDKAIVLLPITSRNFETEDRIVIDTKTQLIYRENGNQTRYGDIYNNYIKEGNFFKIPKGDSKIVFDKDNVVEKIEYDYLYL